MKTLHSDKIYDSIPKIEGVASNTFATATSSVTFKYPDAYLQDRKQNEAPSTSRTSARTSPPYGSVSAGEKYAGQKSHLSQQQRQQEVFESDYHHGGGSDKAKSSISASLTKSLKRKRETGESPEPTRQYIQFIIRCYVYAR